MSSATSSAVAGGASQQAGRLALLAKLFQTTGKSAQDGKKSPAQDAAAPPPPPPPPAQSNSAAGLASMFEALQNPENGSVADLLSRLLQAVDTDGDGTISADELQAVTELTSGPPPQTARPAVPGPDGLRVADNVAARPLAGPRGDSAAGDSDGTLSQGAFDQFEQTVAAQAEPGLDQAAVTGQTATAYEALFQALQVVFAEAQGTTGASSGRRYADVLQSLAKAA